MLSPPAFLMKLPILRRLIPSVLKRYAGIFKHRYSIERRMGALYLLDQKNSVDRNLLIKGSWEPAQIAMLGDLLKTTKKAGEKAVFLDIGAHGALYSIIMRQTGLFERVVAFEPEPANLAQLRANLFINDLLGKIEVLELAASDQRGKIPFFIASDANRGGSRMTETVVAAGNRVVGAIEVEAAPVDAVIDFSGGLVVAKIDVEGSELTVLKGMDRVIADNRCLFQIESFAPTDATLKARLGELGFRHVATRDFDHFFVKDVLVKN